MFGTVYTIVGGLFKASMTKEEGYSLKKSLSEISGLIDVMYMGVSGYAGHSWVFTRVLQNLAVLEILEEALRFVESETAKDYKAETDVLFERIYGGLVFFEKEKEECKRFEPTGTLTW